MLKLFLNDTRTYALMFTKFQHTDPKLELFFLFLQITSKCQTIRYWDIKIVYICAFVDDFLKTF